MITGMACVPASQACAAEAAAHREHWSWLHAGMRIRDASPDELQTVGEVRVAAYVADGFLSADSAYTPRLRALGADGDGDVLVAVGEDADGTGQGEVLGTVMIRSWPGGELMRTADEAEVRALAVAPDARGLGIGRKLVRAVVERARASGVRHLVLASQPDMVRAHHLYLEAGFTRMPERDWAPVPGVTLLAFGLRLDASS
jgi:ribosomal protein S18 acetylase RimI-like enzyme